MKAKEMHKIKLTKATKISMSLAELNAWEFNKLFKSSINYLESK